MVKAVKESKQVCHALGFGGSKVHSSMSAIRVPSVKLYVTKVAEQLRASLVTVPHFFVFFVDFIDIMDLFFFLSADLMALCKNTL